jgi:hypothetical protein
VGAWQLGRDVVALGPIRLAVQRIAASHWQPSSTLRSWGMAPLHREGDALLAPCAKGEALWIGAWLEDGNAPASVRLSDPATGASATAALPQDFQLAALAGPGQAPVPIALPRGGRRTLNLELSCGAVHAAVKVLVLDPAEWAARAGRGAPPQLVHPPPLPPLLG